MNKKRRQQVILELVTAQPVASQEELRQLLAELAMALLSTPSPPLSAARTWKDGSVVPLERVVQKNYQWVALSLRGEVLAAQQ